MNTYVVKLVVKTYSEDPEEWIIDAIGDKLEEDESILSFAIERIES
jgi:hypothetical protein